MTYGPGAVPKEPNNNSSGEETPNNSGNQQVTQSAGNPRFKPGLDPDPNPKVVVRAVNPPVTPDQVVGMAETPASASLPDVKLEKIRSPRVQNKSIQGYLKAIEAKMTQTEKLMKDVVKLQNLQIVTEKELYERKRELYQNTFEEYLLDKTIDFGDGPGGSSCTCINLPKKGGGFPPLGGSRPRRPGGGVPPMLGPGAIPLEEEAEEKVDTDENVDLGTRDFGDDYAKREQEAFEKARQWEKQKELETGVAVPGKPSPTPQEQEEEAEVEVTPPEVPSIIPRTEPIVVPEPKADPADIQTDIEALKHLYEQQPTFTGGLVGNMIPPESMIHERDDGYVVIVSPNPRQAGEAPNPFVNDGKVRILSPGVTVLRPEDVAALKSSDMAKVAQTMEVYNAISDVIQAMYGLKGVPTRRSSGGRRVGSAHSRVTPRRMEAARNYIRKLRRQAQPVPSSKASAASAETVVSETPAAPQTLVTGGMTARQRALMRGGSKNPDGATRLSRRSSQKDRLTKELRRKTDTQSDNQALQAELSGRTTPQGSAARRQAESDMLLEKFLTPQRVGEVMSGSKVTQEKPGVFDITNAPQASGGIGEMNLYDSGAKQYFRNISSNINIPRFADGGFNLLNPMSWFSGDLKRAQDGKLENVSNDTFAGKLYNRRRQQEEMMKKLRGYQSGGLVGWWNKGRNMRVPSENTATWKDLMADDAKQLTRTNKAFKSGSGGVKGWRPLKAFTPEMVKTGPTPAVRQAFERPVRAARGAVKPGHPLVMLAELIINELVNPQSTAVYDQVTGPNAYYNDPAYKGPMPSQNLENAQTNMMSNSDNQQPQIMPLPPNYIQIPKKKSAVNTRKKGNEQPGIDIESTPFTRSTTIIDPGFGDMFK